MQCKSRFHPRLGNGLNYFSDLRKCCPVSSVLARPKSHYNFRIKKSHQPRSVAPIFFYLSITLTISLSHYLSITISLSKSLSLSVSQSPSLQVSKSPSLQVSKSPSLQVSTLPLNTLHKSLLQMVHLKTLLLGFDSAVRHL